MLSLFQLVLFHQTLHGYSQFKKVKYVSAIYVQLGGKSAGY